MIRTLLVIVLAADLMDIFKIKLIFYDNDVIKYKLEVENMADFSKTHRISAC